jgi:hypothetical protein
MSSFPCPYLNGDVELTDERERHIAERHPDLLPAHRDRIADTLADPDEVRRSTRLANARLFARQFDTMSGKYVVVVVVTDSGSNHRHWVITAYLARRLAEGEPEWQRS